jgi:hypothetical protein
VFAESSTPNESDDRSPDFSVIGVNIRSWKGSIVLYSGLISVLDAWNETDFLVLQSSLFKQEFSKLSEAVWGRFGVENLKRFSP